MRYSARTMKFDLQTKTSQDSDQVAGESTVCVLTFNANDPSGSGGLSADILSMTSVGVHVVPIMTGSYVRDTNQIIEHFSVDEDIVGDQARAILEDLTVQAIKVGFSSSPETLAVIAETLSDYPEIPVVAYMPDLSWWNDVQIDIYHDAFKELVLPQTALLVGNHSTLSRWLLPDWSEDRAPLPRDLAMAAGEFGVSYVLVTGVPLPDQHIDNVLASPQSTMGNIKFERIEATFAGVGDTLSATLSALIASGCALSDAFSETMGYLDQCLDYGFRPGMGHAIPDRLFWAQAQENDDDDDEAPATSNPFQLPPHDTQH
jgi:hydroxymethylpyrimidine/phosphomethylpyrimidine kinase